MSDTPITDSIMADCQDDKANAVNRLCIEMAKFENRLVAVTKACNEITHERDAWKACSVKFARACATYEGDLFDGEREALQYWRELVIRFERESKETPIPARVGWSGNSKYNTPDFGSNE